MDTIIFYNGHKYCAELPEKYLYPIHVRLLSSNRVIAQYHKDGAWQDVTEGLAFAHINNISFVPKIYDAYELQRPPENLRLHTQERRIKELADIVNVQPVPVPEYATIDQRLAVVEENVALIREKLGLV